MTQAPNPRPNRVVIVDDDARIRDLLRRYLTQEGFDVLGDIGLNVERLGTQRFEIGDAGEGSLGLSLVPLRASAVIR